MSDLEAAEPYYLDHANPVLRERSDFIIHAPVYDPGPQVYVEQLYARRLTDQTFEVCCIPFFLYGVALSDVVHTPPNGTPLYLVDDVVGRSGRFVFRVRFKPLRPPASDGMAPPMEETPKGFVVDRLRELGCLMEWFSPGLLAVDSAHEHQAREVASFLAQQEASDRLWYESGSPPLREPEVG